MEETIDLTKKAKILKLISEKQWYFDACSISYDEFESIGLCPRVEYGETYNDVIYTRKVLNQAGYKAIIGSFGLHIYRKKLQ